eukprot:6177697-Pleurochrysis_carterae.AAC.1
MERPARNDASLLPSVTGPSVTECRGWLSCSEQVAKHALSLNEQLIRRKGQTTSQHADSVRGVRPGGLGNVKHATHNTP